MKPFRRVEPTVVQKVGHRSVVTKHFVMPDGSTYDFQTFNAEGTEFAGVVALTPDRQVITAYQYRPGPEAFMYEIPGGGTDDGDDGDMAVTATRELREETGYKPGTLTYLGKVYKDAYNNATWHYFLAEDCVLDGEQELDATEAVEVRLVPIDRFLDYARNGQMTDTEAVLLAYDRLMALGSVRV
ncbi:MAG TPA: NUDIX hydrolase [Candidatus Saccharimonadales bacterium]|nr:NUDIX hydrolase [Candidatus Saccharimonadales bacterium]